MYKARYFKNYTQKAWNCTFVSVSRDPYNRSVQFSHIGLLHDEDALDST